MEIDTLKMYPNLYVILLPFGFYENVWFPQKLINKLLKQKSLIEQIINEKFRFCSLIRFWNEDLIGFVNKKNT